MMHDLFAAAGVTGFLHARNLDTGAEFGHQPDEPVVAASTFKLPVLVELFRQADAGEIDLTEQVMVPAAGRTIGPTGISVMLDPVSMSWRDLALGMMVVSDNAATDIICARVGLDRVNATMKELGLVGTQIPYDCAGLFKEMAEDLGITSAAELPDVPTPEQLEKLRALRPVETIHTTPRDMTHLLALILDDEVASAEACAAIRGILGRQVWPHRLASGFPEDDVRTGGKTGTLFTTRNEVGFVLTPQGRFVVAVFTVAEVNKGKDPKADAVIGASARVAVDALSAALTEPLLRVTGSVTRSP